MDEDPLVVLDALEFDEPELDDVVRISDETLRGDGRIQSEHDEIK